jgi:hypothetical protein
VDDGGCERAITLEDEGETDLSRKNAAGSASSSPATRAGRFVGLLQAAAACRPQANACVSWRNSDPGSPPFAGPSGSLGLRLPDRAMTVPQQAR